MSKFMKIGLFLVIFVLASVAASFLSENDGFDHTEGKYSRFEGRKGLVTYACTPNSNVTLELEARRNAIAGDSLEIFMAYDNSGQRIILGSASPAHTFHPSKLLPIDSGIPTVQFVDPLTLPAGMFDFSGQPKLWSFFIDNEEFERGVYTDVASCLSIHKDAINTFMSREIPEYLDQKGSYVPFQLGGVSYTNPSKIGLTQTRTFSFVEGDVTHEVLFERNGAIITRDLLHDEKGSRYANYMYIGNIYTWSPEIENNKVFYANFKNNEGLTVPEQINSYKELRSRNRQHYERIYSER